MKILVTGVTGMLGHKVYQILSEDMEHDVYGVARNVILSDKIKKIETLDDVIDVMADIEPDVTINCIGKIKQLNSSKEEMYRVNAEFPKKLSKMCDVINGKLVHISTDCVFKGDKGGYTEDDIPDATDDYALSKRDGEICDKENCLTIRTSLIGHELNNKLSLVEWFLGRAYVDGYSNAFFSGVTNIELARVLGHYVLPFIDRLSGLYHVSASPISKYDLLQKINKIYNAGIIINREDNYKIDRSLDSDKFALKTGYECWTWEEMITSMYEDYCKNILLYNIKNHD